MNKQHSTIPVSSKIVEKRCSTNYDLMKLIYNWEITGFVTKIALSDECLKSMEFREEFPRKSKWQLIVEPNITKNNTFIHFAVRLKETDETSIESVVKFCILNPNGGIAYQHAKRRTFTKEDNTLWIMQYREAVLSKTNPMIFNDQLTIRVEICILGTETTSDQTRSEFYEMKQSQNFEQIWKSELLSDVTLTLGVKSFHAHKVILAAHSPVFSAMFQHDMRENAENKVTISDIDPEVFQVILQLIYTGQISTSIIDTMAVKLLAAADKYGMNQLREICVDSLRRNLSRETAVETLITAIRHSVDELKQQAIDFIENRAVKETTNLFGITAYPEVLREFTTARIVNVKQSEQINKEKVLVRARNAHAPYVKK